LAYRKNSNSGPNHIATSLGNCDVGKKGQKSNLMSHTPNPEFQAGNAALLVWGLVLLITAASYATGLRGKEGNLGLRFRVIGLGFRV